MARQTRFSAGREERVARAGIMLLLCAGIVASAAANPLGAAVAGAPSLFVLAVGAADGANGAAAVGDAAASAAQTTASSESREVSGEACEARTALETDVGAAREARESGRDMPERERGTDRPRQATRPGTTERDRASGAELSALERVSLR